MFSAMALLNVVCIFGSPVFCRNSNPQLGFVEFGFRKKGFGSNLRNDYERMSSLNCDNLAERSLITHDQDANLSALEKYQSIGFDDKHLNSLPKALSSRNLSLSPSDGSKVRVAYQGVQGKEAAQKAHRNCQTVPCDEHEGAFKAVQCWRAEKAVIAIENSITGSFHRNYDLLLRYGLFIVGEVQLLGDEYDDVTRYLVLAREPIIPGTDRPYKTSIVLGLENKAGVVFKALAAFAFREISLSKIESLPQKRRSNSEVGTTAKSFEYVFYLDFEASMADIPAQHALAHLQEFAKFIRLLGCYPMDTSL